MTEVWLDTNRFPHETGRTLAVDFENAVPLTKWRHKNRSLRRAFAQSHDDDDSEDEDEVDPYRYAVAVAQLLAKSCQVHEAGIDDPLMQCDYPPLG